MSAPNTAVSASSPGVTEQRVVFLTRVISKRSVSRPLIDQSNHAVLQIRERAAVDDCKRSKGGFQYARDSHRLPTTYIVIACCNYAARVATRMRLKLTLASGRLAAPKSARLARSALRSYQHVTVGANVIYRRSYGPFRPRDRCVLRFFRTAASRWS